MDTACDSGAGQLLHPMCLPRAVKNEPSHPESTAPLPNGHWTTSLRPIDVFALTDTPILAQGLTSIGKGMTEHLSITACISDLSREHTPWQGATPDVVLMDMALGAEKVLGWLQHWQSKFSLKVLLLRQHQDDAFLEQAILAGARGCLDHRASPEMLLAAIEKIHHGEFWLEHTTTSRFLGKWIERERATPDDGLSQRLNQLTVREHKILCALITYDADSAKSIAERLHISESTLRNHLTSIYSKMGVRNRNGLTSLAGRNGLSNKLKP